ncbi:MAG: DUF4345 domain-containing protein [Rhodoferax sp.]|nr:DUF4345 domain-containing protein [Rhodoferax sp.]
MTNILQILLVLVAVICTGVSQMLLRSGGKLFQAATDSPSMGLDNLLRFFGGFILGFAILCAWAAVRISEQGELIYVIGTVLFLAALGRLLSRKTVGVPPPPRGLFMWGEFVLGTSIIAVQYLRA